MVCNRCITAVKNELASLGLQPLSIALGEVLLPDGAEINKPQMAGALAALGFELIDDHKSRLIEKIKTLVIDLVHHAQEPIRLKYSEHIASALHHDYTHLSNLFSQVEGITIEQYIITQKIERVKELLVYNELTLTQIADMMNYSSVAHLSAQFKKVTGLTPGFYKKDDGRKRQPLDQLGRKDPLL